MSSTSAEPVTVYIGLGTNMGERRRQLRQAVCELRQLSQAEVLRLSSIYETEPWGYADQPDYLNMVVESSWSGAAVCLLKKCQEIERSLGRTRTTGESSQRWGPRLIDLDILLFGSQLVNSSELVIPHPRMHRRAFVMVPLAELNPEVSVRGRAAADWAGQLEKQQGIRRLGRLETI